MSIIQTPVSSGDLGVFSRLALNNVFMPMEMNHVHHIRDTEY